VAGPDDRYHVLRTIKRGGMSEVFEAVLEKPSGIEVRVALKKLLQANVEDESMHRGFFDAAKILAQLSHANLVRILDYGELDGAPFLAEELIDGEDLAELKRRADPFPEEVALHIAAEVAHALAYVHEAKDRHGRPLGVVHRDVSPENILISWAGDVKLTDFGIAFARERREVTEVGIAKGKTGYMAPEQLYGERVDGRTDVFGLGSTLSFVVGGTPSEEIARIVRRSRQAAIDARYPDARSMALDLGRALRSRIETDGRTMLLDWLGSLSSRQVSLRTRDLDGLFQLELAEKTPEPGPRRFHTVMKSHGAFAEGGEEPTALSTQPARSMPGFADQTELSFTTMGLDTRIRDPASVGTTMLPQPSAPTSKRTIWIAAAAFVAVVIAIAVVVADVSKESELIVVPEPAPQIRPATPEAKPHGDVAAVARPTEQVEPPRTEAPEAAEPSVRGSEHRRERTRGQNASASFDAESAIARALDRRGLLLADLDDLLASRRSVAAECIKARSADACDPALRAIATSAIDAPLFEKKLARVATKLRAIASSTPAPLLDRLDSRLIDLRVAAHAAKGAGEGESVARKISTLERDIDRRKSGASP
jgi:serine/threonine-protein kinase